MKKIKKTKEEKLEIKKFKEEEKQKVLDKEKIKLHKEHFILLFAVLLLIFLLAILVYMLFFVKKREAIVPDSPSYEKMDIGIVDFKDNGATANDLNSKKNSNLNVTYKIVSDYYSKGILLSNTQVDYLNESFAVTSGPNSPDAFISSLTIDGNLNWITKLDDKEFGSIHVYKTIYYNDNYYVIGISEKNASKNIVVIKVNSNGKRITTRIINNNVDEKIKDVLLIERKIVIITEDTKVIKVYFTNDNLEENKKYVSSLTYLKDLTSLYYEASSSVDKTIKIACVSGDTHYIMEVNSDNYEAKVYEFSEANSLVTNSKKKVTSYLKGFTVLADNILYKFDSDNRLVNKFDYNSIKLEDTKEYKEKYKNDEYIDVEDMENSIYINKVVANSNSIIVSANTMFSNIYDTYDLNLKINKRIMLDTFKYSYDEGILLNTFYINNAIYEVYSYGKDTPSIMISKIG